MHKHKTILITGGAGYIGSHIAVLLTQNGYRCIVMDLKKNSSLEKRGIIFLQEDFAGKDCLKNLATRYQIDAVIHCAANTIIQESNSNPLKFYDSNVIKTLRLLEWVVELNIKKFIFASSCAVYGSAQENPIPESAACNPISAYGRSKFMIEQILADCASAYDLKYVILRYFNVAGAWPEFDLYEDHSPETHLIPLVLRAIREKTPFSIFGTNLATPDGSCIRDYVHVRDVAHAHLLALNYLDAGNSSDCFNVGSGKGTSVLEIVKAAENILGTHIELHYKPSRAGDPATLVGDVSKIQHILGWQPVYSSVETIVRSAHSTNGMFKEKILSPTYQHPLSDSSATPK